MTKETTVLNNNSSTQDSFVAIQNILMGDFVRRYDTLLTEFKLESGNANQDLNAKIEELRQNILQQLKETEERLLATIQRNHQAVMAEIHRLDEQTVDRRQLGKLLTEMGKQIGG